VIWSAVYYTYFLLHGYESFSLSRFITGLISGTLFGPFYFIVVIVQFYLLTPLWKQVTERISPKVAIPIALLLTPLFYVNFPKLLRAIEPSWRFLHTDRLFLTYLAYFAAGCYAGARFDAFVSLLRRYRRAVAAAFALFGALDVGLGWCVSTGRLVFPQLEYVHYLYCLSAVAFFMAVFVSLEHRLPNLRLVRAVDNVSFSIYLSHGLLIYIINEWMVRLGVRRIGTQYLLRTVFVYAGTIALCVGFRAVTRRFCIGKRERAHR
jgi:membrane-bound acyltransferase YfiQ involved in biofilm formation